MRLHSSLALFKLVLALSVMLGMANGRMPPLPQWTAEELEWMQQDGPDLGGALFSGEGEQEDMGTIEHTEIPQDDVQVPEVIHLGKVEDLPADLVERYFPETLEERVLDPQSQITHSRREGILHFLDYHFREARSAVHILVLKPMQRLPSHLDLNHIHEKWFGDSLSVLVVYNFGNPEMSRLVFGQHGDEHVPEARRVNACVESINEAMVASNAEDQLERFLTELSRKLYWVEQDYYGALKAEAKVSKPEAVTPVAALETPVSRRKLWFSILTATAVLIMGAASILALQRRAANKTFYFPEHRIRERLGAPYGGGNRVVVSFGQAQDESKAG